MLNTILKYFIKAFCMIIGAIIGFFLGLLGLKVESIVRGMCAPLHRLYK
jgi:ABC-type amino acid transport system permease subunit